MDSWCSPGGIFESHLFNQIADPVFGVLGTNKVLKNSTSQEKNLSELLDFWLRQTDRGDIIEILNLQPKGSESKPYQIK
jgi:hypothetical protein